MYRQSEANNVMAYHSPQRLLFQALPFSRFAVLCIERSARYQRVNLVTDEVRSTGVAGKQKG